MEQLRKENEMLRSKVAFLERQAFKDNIKMQNDKIKIQTLELIIRKHFRRK